MSRQWCDSHSDVESTATDVNEKCQLAGLPAGLVVATADAPGYDQNSIPVDLTSGPPASAEIQFHRHHENTAAFERELAQTGQATIYGIHFDTDSAKLRPDSMPALNAVMGLINNHPELSLGDSRAHGQRGRCRAQSTLSENRWFGDLLAEGTWR